MRKATVSDTFNAKTIPSSSALILILDAMGNSISDFAKKYMKLLLIPKYSHSKEEYYNLYCKIKKDA